MRGGQRMKWLGGVSLVLLLIANVFIWNAALASTAPGALSVSFLDVGQGDAIFIESPTGAQVLIDGGPGRGVLRELGALMNWSDRSIDMVIATHPDADHIGGLPSVLERYDVQHVVRSGVVEEGASDYEAFEQAIAAETGVQELVAQRGQVFDLGGGAYIEVLFPDRAIPGAEPNLGSVVVRLVYGDTSFMLTGDSLSGIEEYVVMLDRDRLASTVLKAGHHGSKTSSAAAFVGFVSPQYVLYSRGCDNSYGHPHPEVTARFAEQGVTAYDTCDDGTVTFTSNGQTVRVE